MERTRESSRKRQKNVEQNSDRLSGLPDDVLCHVLSFLPTKRSVGTSILSRRWMSLWAHVPVLKFGYNDEVGTLHPDIVSSVLLQHKATNLNTFSLHSLKCSDLILRTWITTALGRNARNVGLFCRNEDRFYNLPQRLFTCKTLVELELGNCKCIPSSGNVSLPSLEKLHLYFVEYEDDKALPHLLSRCPVLEEFTIHSLGTFDHREDLVCDKIFSSTVKTLHVVLDCGCPDNPDCRTIVNAPTLRYLKVDRCCLRCLTILPNTMTSLIEAHLDLVADLGYSDNAVNFLNSLCKAKCLKLSTNMFDDMFGDMFDEPIDLTFGGSVVKFDNLTKLELVELSFDWHDLVKFIGLANNLEELIVSVQVISCVEPKQEPTCLLPCLRTTRFVCSKSGVEEFNMVRYFLRNAPELERMEIRVDFDKEKLEELERISLFERGARPRQIDLCARFVRMVRLNSKCKKFSRF